MKSQFAFKVPVKSIDTQNLLMFGMKQITFFMCVELITSGARIPIWKWQTELWDLNFMLTNFTIVRSYVGGYIPENHSV